MKTSSGGIAFRSIPCCYSVAGSDSHKQKSSSSFSISSFSQYSFPEGNLFSANLKFSARPKRRGGNCSYEDKGHLEYYYGLTTVCGEIKEKEIKRWNGVSTKKRMKLVKGLVKDLSTFSELGFGLDSVDGFDDDAKGKMISEASVILMTQLKQLREEEMESKKKQGKVKVGNTAMEIMIDCESSSSSSESSDSECEEVVRMSSHQSQPVVQLIDSPLPLVSPVENKMKLGCQEPAPSTLIQEASMNENFTSEVPSLKNSAEGNCSNGGTSSGTVFLEQGMEVVSLQNLGQNFSMAAACGSGSRRISQSSANGIVCADPSSTLVRKVEVCMGNKCMKSGSPALMEEFRKVLGFEGAVVGCKCMGKCKSGPNVRVMKSDDSSQAVNSHPLCIGVSLEDVGSILSSI
ncbi:hypothetical protein Nepgr_030468 [Nepenthes gracilis]|uniref:Diacylglycerol O-acyltransferase 3, cytosolic n=1 Tax=Nepenthes gracilis TaxID=150966 RepID=A0AAD3TEP2_NEPGR|nr:hypothetical protein Nepgr_030468 [Nepenthes gracilis]